MSTVIEQEFYFKCCLMEQFRSLISQIILSFVDMSEENNLQSAKVVAIVGGGLVSD